MRKLASLQRITKLVKPEWANTIEVAYVLGWTVVVQQGLHKEGDLIVFFETDSVIPLDVCPELAKQKGRIKTLKIRDLLSQGYIVPIHAIKQLNHYEYFELQEGMDVSVILGVTKWEPPTDIKLQGNNSAGGFPSQYVNQTDEMRLQSCLSVLDELRGTGYYMTQKMDGTSFTCGYTKEGEFCVCSRNQRKSLDPADNIYAYVANKYGLEKKLKGTELWIQGEICGPKIQSNRLDLTEHLLYVFNVVQRNKLLGMWDMSVFCTEKNLLTVPILQANTEFDLTYEDLIEYATGTYFSGHPQEGIVVRPQTPRYSETLKGLLSFKVINPEFLLKIGE